MFLFFVAVICCIGDVILSSEPPLFAPPSSVRPWIDCDFEECPNWRFLERAPSWETQGRPISDSKHNGYFYHNATGSAILASYPLEPNSVPSEEPKHYCVSIVYKICGNPNNSLAMYTFPYPINGKEMPLWEQFKDESTCDDWNVQTSQLQVENKVIILLNGTRYESNDRNSFVRLRNIQVFNSSCHYLSEKEGVTSYFKARKPERNDTLKVIETETFGRIENSADENGRMFQNQSWLIRVPVVEEARLDYYYYEDYEMMKMSTNIAFQFNWLDIEESPNCSEAGLFFYDGTNDSAPLIGSFCGNSRPKEIFEASSNVAYVAFRIYGTYAPLGTGFKFSFSKSQRHVETTQAPSTTSTMPPTTRDVSRLYQYFCDFEDGVFCSSLFENWSLGMFNWKTVQAFRASRSVKEGHPQFPHIDRTLATSEGHYVVAHASSRRPGDVAVLMTKREFTLDRVNCLNFWYYKTRSYTGRLAVSIVDSNELVHTLMVIRGERSGEWRNGQVAVPYDFTGPFKVAFQATAGADRNGTSDFILDDVGMFKSLWCRTID